MNSQQNTLSFSEFEVHFAYGFVLENGDEPSNLIKTLRDVDLPTDWTRYTTLGGWAILYRLRGIEDRLLHLRYEPSTSFRIADSNLKVTFRARVLLRSDGAGAITLTLSAKPRAKGKPYCLSDLARVMSVVPRIYVDPTEANGDKRFELLQPAIRIPEGLTRKQKELFKKSSCAFQLFVLCVSQVAKLGGLNWREVANHSDTGELTPSMYSGEEEDPQIPYMYMFAKVPKDLYENVFREDNDLPEAKSILKANYSRELTAILLRFRKIDNAKHIAESYIRKHLPTLHGAIATEHVNSEFFVAFSNIAALSLQSDAELERIPSYYSRRAILRSLELSKMRWHYAIYLNRLLDDLASSVVARGFAEELFIRLEALSNVRQRAALNLEDPAVYMYDDHIGSELAKHLRERYIDELEQSTRRKLEIIDKLYNDQVQLARVHEYNKLLSGAPEAKFAEYLELKSARRTDS